MFKLNRSRSLISWKWLHNQKLKCRLWPVLQIWSFDFNSKFVIFFFFCLKINIVCICCFVLIFSYLFIFQFIGERSSKKWPVSSRFFFFFFFFFNEIECKKGRTRMMQPLWISKDPCITEEKGKLIKWEGGGVGFCEPGFWRFEDCKCSEKWRQGGSSNSLKS